MRGIFTPKNLKKYNYFHLFLQPDNKLSKNVYSEAKRCNRHLVEVSK